MRATTSSVCVAPTRVTTDRFGHATALTRHWTDTCAGRPFPSSARLRRRPTPSANTIVRCAACRLCAHTAMSSGRAGVHSGMSYVNSTVSLCAVVEARRYLNLQYRERSCFEVASRLRHSCCDLVLCTAAFSYATLGAALNSLGLATTACSALQSCHGTRCSRGSTFQWIFIAHVVDGPPKKWAWSLARAM